MKKRIRALLGIASLAALTLVGGTWAAGSQEIITGNEFQTAYYSTKLEEKFQSPDNWKPGVEMEKDVWVNNTGEVPVITKVVLNQEWVRRENVTAMVLTGSNAIVEQVIPPLEGEAYPLTFGPDEEYAAIINFNKNAVVILKENCNPGETSAEGIPYVASLDEAKGKWLLATEYPDADGNWTIYYIGVVAPGTETPHLIESVTMNPKVQNTVIGSETYYVQDTDGNYKQITIDKVNPEFGYDCARYTLTVNMTTVQATQGALEEVFKSDVYTKIVNYLIKDVAGTGIYTSDREKTLTIKEKDGTLGYVPQGAGSGTENGNWFMSFTDMIPGSTYIDQMTIKNDTAYDFHLYMQILERDQAQIPDELLDLISMKVYYENELLYSGTAKGFDIDKEKNLQNVTYLGLHTSRNDSKIRVELQLDPSLELEQVQNADGTYTSTFKYDNVLSKIDWKFWVYRKSDGGGGNTPTPKKSTEKISDSEIPLAVLPTVDIVDDMIPLAVLPATGTTWWLVPILVCAAILLFGVGIRKNGRKEEK